LSQKSDRRNPSRPGGCFENRSLAGPISGKYPNPAACRERQETAGKGGGTFEEKSMKVAWILIFSVVLIWSGIDPKDDFTWFLEVAPALAGFFLIAATYKRFPLTRLTYTLILIHCVILMVGGHYTYAEVPLFNWLRDYFDLARNNYDKVGHFAQGFVPAMIAREIFLRKNIVAGRGWQHFLTVCVCLAISAFYELIEWWVALLSGESAEAFLGTQGYVWDTQSDMALALLGSILSLLLLSKWQDKQMAG
jgi:putative membrane protein